MTRGNQVALNWTDDTVVVISVHVLPRNRLANGEEWRLAQEIAARIWAEWHLAELDTAREQ